MGELTKVGKANEQRSVDNDQKQQQFLLWNENQFGSILSFYQRKMFDIYQEELKKKPY